MEILLTDIPPQGKVLDFELDDKALNQRIEDSRNRVEKGSLPPPEYLYTNPPTVNLVLRKEGMTVVATGIARASFKTTCARCAEDIEQEMEVPLEVVFKPAAQYSPETREDDVGLSFHDGEKIDCSTVPEEMVLLGLPVIALCKTDCRGLCGMCGINKNIEDCECGDTDEGDPRLSVLRDLKIH